MKTINLITKYSHVKMRFGKYKGKLISQVPDSYLAWLLSINFLKGKALMYAKAKLDLAMDEYVVTIEDAVIGNGEYKIKAYHPNHAIMLVKLNNHIQCTQSFHGTSIGAVQL